MKIAQWIFSNHNVFLCCTNDAIYRWQLACPGDRRRPQQNLHEINLKAVCGSGFEHLLPPYGNCTAKRAVSSKLRRFWVTEFYKTESVASWNVSVWQQLFSNMSVAINCHIPIIQDIIMVTCIVIYKCF